MTYRRPLVDAMINFQQRQPISFHVPGHKNGQLSALPKALKAALAYDFTELTGLDDLHYPEEVIDAAQQLLAQTYGSAESFFLVNGSTAGNLAMILAVCGESDTVIVQRNSHKSIFHALELARVKPVYATPEWDEASKTAAGLQIQDIEAAVTAYPEAKAVILTHPNYYGMATKDLEAIISFCHEREIPVLVDEAHGAHFVLGSPFPKSSLELGADIVVQSAHKSLPAMTMGSFLHVQGELINAQRVKKYLRMLQSSSPSYLIMASLDDARSYVQTYTHPDKRSFQEKHSQFVEGLKSIPKLEIFESDDPLKLMLRVEHHSGYQLKSKLEALDIHAELADPFQVLLILPLLKHGHSYPFAEIRSRIKEAVQAVLQEERIMIDTKISVQQTTNVPELSFKALEEEKAEWLPYTKALGRISAGMVVPYPPGIPLILPGEKWTLDKLGSLADHMATQAQIQGDHRLDENLVSVVIETIGQ